MMRQRCTDVTRITMKLVLTVYNENRNRWMSEFMNLQTYSSLLDIRRTAYTTTCNLYFYCILFYFISLCSVCHYRLLRRNINFFRSCAFHCPRFLLDVFLVNPWVMSLVRACLLCICICMYVYLYIYIYVFLCVCVCVYLLLKTACIRVQTVIILEDIENSLHYVK